MKIKNTRFLNIVIICIEKSDNVKIKKSNAKKTVKIFLILNYKIHKNPYSFQPSSVYALLYSPWHTYVPTYMKLQIQISNHQT